MTDREQVVNVIDTYTSLLRVKKAEGSDREREIDNQLRIARAKLEAFGVVAEDLDIE